MAGQMVLLAVLFVACGSPDTLDTAETATPTQEATVTPTTAPPEPTDAPTLAPTLTPTPQRIPITLAMFNL